MNKLHSDKQDQVIAMLVPMIQRLEFKSRMMEEHPKLFCGFFVGSKPLFWQDKNDESTLFIPK